MTEVFRSALQHLSCRDGKLLLPNDEPFDVLSYSRFKYGNATVPQGYGFDLAARFIEDSPLALSHGRVMVTAASYKYLPTPSQTIATAFLAALNCYRIRHEQEPGMMLHIIRSQVGTDSYAMVSAQERATLLGQSSHHVDRELIRDSVVIAIDDVKVTGSTEQRMHTRLMACKPAVICYLHVAALDKDSATYNASIEHAMNRAFTSTLETIAQEIDHGSFVLGSRVFDFILQSNSSQLAAFLEQRSDAFLEELMVALVNSTGEMYRRYPQGTLVLETQVIQRRLPIARFITDSRMETYDRPNCNAQPV